MLRRKQRRRSGDTGTVKIAMARRAASMLDAGKLRESPMNGQTKRTRDLVLIVVVTGVALIVVAGALLFFVI